MSGFSNLQSQTDTLNSLSKIFALDTNVYSGFTSLKAITTTIDNKLISSITNLTNNINTCALQTGFTNILAS